MRGGKTRLCRNMDWRRQRKFALYCRRKRSRQCFHYLLLWVHVQTHKVMDRLGHLSGSLGCGPVWQLLSFAPRSPALGHRWRISVLFALTWSDVLPTDRFHRRRQRCGLKFEYEFARGTKRYLFSALVRSLNTWLQHPRVDTCFQAVIFVLVRWWWQSNRLYSHFLNTLSQFRVRWHWRYLHTIFTSGRNSDEPNLTSSGSF